MNFAIVATIAGGLLLDQHWAQYGQVVVSAFVWLMFAGLWMRSDARRRPALLACLVYATAGEAFLSLAWGLYDYRLRQHPAVRAAGPRAALLPRHADRRAPAGARRMVDRRARLPDRRRLRVDRPRHAGPAALSRSSSRACGCRRRAALRDDVRARRSRWNSTARGWATGSGRSDVPWLGLAADNPPLAAGAFYCVLDLLVVSSRATRRCQSRRAPASRRASASHQAATCSARSSSR